MHTKKILSAILLTFCAIMLTACIKSLPQAESEEGEASNTPMQNLPSVAASPMENLKIVLYPAGLDIPVGRNIALIAKTDGTESVDWTSSDPSIATVEPDGKVRTLSAGETTITASQGECSDACRITVTENGVILAYPEDPGPRNEDGEHEPVGTEENYPVIIPDDQASIDESLFEDAEYSWQLIIDDGFDTQLNVPNAGFSYMVNCHIYLDAGRVGGSTVTGDYKGTMEMEMAIDEESFLKAMQSMDVPATNMSFAVQTKTVDVNFSVVPYQMDEINKAKDAFLPSGKIPTQALVLPLAMAISSANTSTSGSISIEAEEGYGNAVLADEKGSIPYVIEVGQGGAATLYLPKMLSMCNRNDFHGTLARLQIVDLP
jgi:hypothetical protein